MNDIPRHKEMSDIEYLRLKNEINDLPKPLRELIIFVLQENERLESLVIGLQNTACHKCKYFDK